VLAASVFHFGTLRIADVKRALADAGYPVRLPVAADPERSSASGRQDRSCSRG
jgi:hypothetical protein